ncbi:MAG: hypothetical protein GXP40_07860 [Chloroflexi bacterium]|nr:hypothetical protein [Chloroflexota bacterium]
MNNYTTSPSSQKPELVTIIAIMTLANGIINILWGLGVTTAVVLGTLFIGIICAPFTILPTILGIFEVIYASKLLSDPPQPIRPSQSIAILEIVAVITGNVLSLIVGILVLVFYNDSTVKRYFAEINGRVGPVEPPVGPTPVTQPEPATPKEAAPKPGRAQKAAKPKSEAAKKPAKPKQAKKPAKAKTAQPKEEKPAKPETKKKGRSTS